MRSTWASFWTFWLNGETDMPVRVDYRSRLLVPVNVAAAMMSMHRTRISWLLQHGWLRGTKLANRPNSKQLVSVESMEAYAADPPPISPWELPENGGMDYAERERRLRRLRKACASVGGDDVVHSVRHGAGRPA